MTDTTNLDRIEGLVRRLERLGVNLTDSVKPLAPGDLPPYVATGELIESAWGNAVVDDLANDRQNHIIGGTFTSDWPAPANGVEWVGENLTVPAWATKAYVTVNLCGVTVSPTSTGVMVYELWIVIGTGIGTAMRYGSPAVNSPQAIVWTDGAMFVTPGPVRLSIHTTRISGDGTLKATVNSSLRYLIRYEH